MRIVLALGAWMVGFVDADAGEVSGYLSAEARLFFHDALFGGQEDHNGSIAAQPEYYHEWENGSSFTFVPFARLDSADHERTHVDIRELNYLWPGDSWYVRLGLGKVFWGATEFVHLVDIVNQTDLVEHVDGEDKLGQPMVQFSISPSWGTVDFFVLPYFRERTFPGRHGRLRPGPVIDTDRALYESTAGENHVDMAVRYSHTIGDCDFGVYFFRGTNREPLLAPPPLLDPNATGDPTLIPFYEQINQVGTDVQWAMGNWLWKLEALYCDGSLDNHVAAVGGFEYTFFGVGGGKTDIGLLSEYAYDERGDDVTSTTPFDNDAFLGMRLTPNDTAGTQLLVGVMQDIDDAERILSIEGSRRIGSHWRLILEVWLFLDSPEDSPLYGLRDDDFARLELAYYF